MRVVNENISEKKGKSFDLDFDYTLEQVSKEKNNDNFSSVYKNYIDKLIFEIENN